MPGSHNINLINKRSNPLQIERETYVHGWENHLHITRPESKNQPGHNVKEKNLNK